MIQTYFKIAWCNPLYNKIAKGVSIFGLTVGLVSFIFSVVYMGIAKVIFSPIAGYIMNEWLKRIAYGINFNVDVFFISLFGVGTFALISISFQIIKAAIANPGKNLRTE